MSAAGTILIVGASGRAAAASAIRAGWKPFVIDLFADEDTAQLCGALKCPLEDYPHGFIELATQAPPGPWMYTGGMENYPEVVQGISKSRTLFGVGRKVLKKVRDPFALTSPSLGFRALSMPEMKDQGEPLDRSKRWLKKPYRGSGGYGIEELLPSASPKAPLGEFYAQEFVDGLSYSALFLFPRTGHAQLIGYSSQLIGEPWLNAPPFRYCGNIGPLPIDSDNWEYGLTLSRIGLGLEWLKIRGLAGIDFIRQSPSEWALEKCGLATVVLEVNPRYTASVELYERALGRSLLLEHIRCFETSHPGPLSEAERGDEKIHGKAILYADRTFEVPAHHPWRGPAFADIPTVGSVIPKGQPVVTLFASGDTEPECRERLKELARKSAPR